jgi:hypothetical protein
MIEMSVRIGGRTCLSDDLEHWARIDHASFEQLKVGEEARDAVRVSSLEVSSGEHIGSYISIFLGDTEVHEDILAELAKLARLVRV